jgi:hypothetical protein
MNTKELVVLAELVQRIMDLEKRVAELEHQMRDRLKTDENRVVV